MRVEEFTFADTVTEAQRACYRLIAAQAAENPQRNGDMTFEEFVRRASDTGPMVPKRRFLLARGQDGSVVGTADVVLPVQDNTHMVGLGVYVAKEHRRRGIATALIAEALACVRDEGRSILWMGAVRSGSPGAAVASALDLSPTYSYVQQVLEIQAVAPAAWRAEAPEGFRLEFWTDATPEALVESYARARSAIAGAPLQRSVFNYPEWTAEMVRHQEERWRRLGEQHSVLAAVHEESGDVAAITEVSLLAPDAKRMDQQYTAVVPDYRRRGLAVWVKGEMMRRLVELHPHVRTVITGTAADNIGMITVNERIGYRTVGVWMNYETEIAQIEARVAAVLSRRVAGGEGAHDS